MTREIELLAKISAVDGHRTDDEEFLDHAEVVSRLAWLLSKKKGLPEDVCTEMAVAGMLHDIGKKKHASSVYGPNHECRHVARLMQVRTHPTLCNDILEEQGYSRAIIDAVSSHHENYDGTGYPGHLEGEQIPVGGRILRICDVFAALVAHRSYRKAFSIDDAIKTMITEVKKYDMELFLLFMNLVYSEEFAPVRALIEASKQRFCEKYHLAEAL